MVAKNQVEFDWSEDEHPRQIDDVNPKYNQYHYVQSDGKTVTHKHNTNKRLDGAAKLKDMNALENAMTFMEGVGMGSGADPSTIQITNDKYGPFKESGDALRTSCLFICTNITPYIYIHN